MVYEHLETSVIIDTNMNSSQPNADTLTFFLPHISNEVDLGYYTLYVLY